MTLTHTSTPPGASDPSAPVATPAAIAHGSPWTVAGTTLASRFFLGTSHYPSPLVLGDAVRASGTEVLTVVHVDLKTIKEATTISMEEPACRVLD